MQELRRMLEGIENRSRAIRRPNADIDASVELTRPDRITELEQMVARPDFWNNPEVAGKLSKELSGLKEELVYWQDFQKKLDGYLAESDEELVANESEIRNFKKSFDREYIKIYLSGKYDKGNALLYIYSGAGGVDAQDWAGMLLRMYQRYAAGAGCEFTLLDQSLGEQNGYKSAVAEVSGRYAFGKLKGEAGVHRLVRISPFSAKSLRHTSFVLVDILPEVEDAPVQIDSKDLRIDTYRSSGPGGQNVNKLETAVRITHLPTGIVAAAQSERSQAQNKAKAMILLESRIIKLMEEKKIQALSDLRIDTKDSEIEWGSQIRSYVLHPYKLVKDHRTKVETSQVDEVLAGNLDEFIEAELIK